MNAYQDGKYLKTAFTAREIAAEESFWLELFEKAGTDDRIDRLLRMREYLRNGGPVFGLIAAADGNSRWGKIPEVVP